ncbi:MAG: UDP-N-acetylmuramoyl-tripeptide--D-alanyl-D-alanine ligase [Patescibacteria group bacterium]|nr:UDP-N-acetylmuramoyl-tripeptide--D-alanyl-D-alanine ligase [Patescibacteria group bacterium]
MRIYLRNILRGSLALLARLTIWRFSPGVVGVTGSVGKTSAKIAIAAVLRSGRRVRAARGNLNNDFGLPLTILGDWSERDAVLVSREGSRGHLFRKSWFWCRVLCGSVVRLIFYPKKSYPEILVLEYGADKPGDIKYLLSIARPSVAVITAVGTIPVHVEFYSGQEEVAREKARLIEALPAAGFAVLNHDDNTVMRLQERTRAHVTTFGFEKGSEVILTRFEHRIIDGRPVGVSFKIEHIKSFVPVRIDGVFGRAHAYAAGAATAVGLIFGMNLVAISESLQHYVSAPGRMDLKKSVRDSYLLNDSYNASPLSMRAALATLRDLPGKRKIAILGDMLEVGKYAIDAHREVGRFAEKCADILITVGPRGKFIAEAAMRAGMHRDKVMSFDEAEEVIPMIDEELRTGDLVLVKGSHAMLLDQIAKAIDVENDIPTAIPA